MIRKLCSLVALLATLVAHARAADPIDLQLEAPAAAVYSHPAPVWLPQGWTRDAFLLSDGRPVPAQVQIRSRWPDGSAKLAHIYADYHGGRYTLYPFARPSSTAAVDRPAPKITPYLVDELGREYQAGNVTTEKLDSGPIATVYHVAGEMLCSRDQADRLMRVRPFARFEYWATVYATRVDVQHAFTIVDPHPPAIAELRIRTPLAAGQFVFLQDEGRRRPHSTAPDGISLWPRGGLPATVTTADNFHRFPWLHAGELLQLEAPDQVYQLARGLQADAEKPYRLADGTVSPQFFRSAGEWSESRAENLRTTSPEGISIACRFSLVDPAGQSADTLRELLQVRPVARQTGKSVCDSLAFGPIAPRSEKFAGFERQIDRALVDWHDAARFGCNGFANFGNVPERERADAVPFQHRACSYSHYWLHPLWLHWLRGAGPDVLEAARRSTDYLAGFGQCRSATMRPDGLPVVRGRMAGGFFHCVNLLPWGNTDYGLNWPDVECSLFGHWPDPYALQLAWQVDCDWFARSGFELWARSTEPATYGYGRESNAMLAQFVYAYRSTGETKWLEGARRLAAALEVLSIEQQQRDQAQGGAGKIGPLWYPTWPLLAEEVLATPASRKYVIDNAAWLLTQSPPPDGITPTAVIARAIELTGDTNLAPALYPLPLKAYGKGFRLGPGPLGEQHHALAWPYVLKTLEATK